MITFVSFLNLLNTSLKRVQNQELKYAKGTKIQLGTPVINKETIRYIRTMKRRIETLSLMIDDFVSVKSTNEQKRFTEQMMKMSSSLYLQPITVIKVSKIPNYSKLTLYDVSSGEIVTDNKKKMNAWLVIDGTKRLKAMM